jgi:hypothetical protein
MPMLDIMGRAFWFLGAKILKIQPLRWVPLAVLFAGQVAIGLGLARLGGGSSDAWLWTSPYAAPAYYLSVALQVITLTVAAVRVHRLALFDDRMPGAFFAFPFGRTEALYVLMVALLIGFFAVLSLGVGVAVETYLTQSRLPPPVPEGGDITPLVPLFLMLLPVNLLALWFAMRLAMWPAAVVANSRLSMIEAWRVSKGYALAMFLVLLAAGQLTGLAFFIRRMVAVADESLGFERSPALLDWKVDPFGMWSVPSANSYATMPSAELLAVDFGLTFFVLTYMAAVVSFAYMSLTRDEPALNFGPVSPDPA